jgi:hypothetical protein
MNFKSTILFLSMVITSNLFAADFSLKFCSADKQSSVKVDRVGSVVNVGIVAPGGINLEMEESIIDEAQINDADLLKIFSEYSGKNIISGTAFGLLSPNGYSSHVEFIGTDSSGDINLFDVRGNSDAQAVDYIGSVKSCD